MQQSITTIKTCKTGKPAGCKAKTLLPLQIADC